jgi:hypothetical protein
MARDENAVMYAVEQVCNLYQVQVTREQSRQFNVQGAAGRWRPMFFGSWTDATGKLVRRVGKGRRLTNVWNAGKADFLARPRIDMTQFLLAHHRLDHDLRYRSVPLWIECKSLTGKQTPDQAAFQTWVESNGDEYLLLREDVRPLIEWFDKHGVSRSGNDEDLGRIVTPLEASALYDLPCKWCGFHRDQHKKPSLACPLELAACNTKLIGKVWSPDLRKGVNREKTSGTGIIGADSERD